MPRQHLRAMIGTLVLTVAALQPAGAVEILAPGSTVAGKSIADWTAGWWTWVFQSPSDAVPFSDPDGSLANLNNGGPVFFVAGTGGGPVERTFSVPAGRPLLIPMVNYFNTYDTEEVINAAIAAFPGSVTDLFAEIDGVPVADPFDYLEVTADFFSGGLAQEGSWIASLGVPVGEDVFPSKSSGYWLMIDGLAPGTHTLRFGGTTLCCGDPFSTEVLAEINVVPEPAPWSLIALGLICVAAGRRRGAALTP